MNRIITRIDVVYRTVRWLQNESDFYDIIEVLTNEDFLRQMAISLKRGTIYAIDAFNPYPPHSYQGAMWKKQNAYLVVES